MANSGKTKLKLLYLKQILEEETDSNHGLTMAELIDRLQNFDIVAERKGVYRDIQTLREFGVDVQTFQRNPVQYAIIKRDFSLSELMLLVDAVESCKSLTKRQSRSLITNLKLLASDHERALLDRRIHVQGRITSKNESVFNSIDLLHEAMRLRRRIEFVYYKVDITGARQATREGRPHVVTPVEVAYSDGHYYLTAWHEDHESLSEYRVDRMGKLRILEDKATRNDAITNHSYDGDDHELFGRFWGDPVTVTLLVDGENIEIITDRFGDRAQLDEHGSNSAKAIVKVRKSPQFFGWIAGLNGTVRIHGPKSLKREYQEYLQGLIDG